ncbi:cation transporter, partial [Nocardia sp. JMUB6875]|uniref:cation transporter n=1 Tax=Nocardia sp. JMUB6875 TaxID=3158170 RepID=UPI0034E8FDCB
MDRRDGQRTAVLDVRGLHWASQQGVVKAVLGRRPGVVVVEANPVAQTATVTFDPAVTSVADLREWVRECGLHCAGQSVPNHVCDPMAEPGGHAGMDHGSHEGHDGHAGMDHSAHAGVDHSAHAGMDHAAMGHGGHAGHAGMSMEDMARYMRNRFVVAAVFSVLVMLWSPMATDMFG